MGALLTLPVTLLNFMLPFTKPGTPLIQDLIHTAILCGTLYFAPQITEFYNARQQQQHQEQQDTNDVTSENDNLHEPGLDPGQEEYIPQEDPPLDERLVLQPSDEDEPLPPPLAPTPPNFQHAQHPPAPRTAGHHNFPDDDDAFQPGPANPNAGPRPTPANRTIGAKKAKSLARKDQRRAYHEFHRQEAELRRLREQEGAEEREVELAAERERRARIEAEIADKEREERSRRKEEERREAELENERRERVIERVREDVRSLGYVDLLHVARKEGKDKMWVLKLVKASGLLPQLSTDGSKAMITGNGWLVKVGANIMEQAYNDAEVHGGRNDGRVSYEELAGFIERAVLTRVKV
ncbi:hypothetical protein GQ44DRAFT_702492 [Phaeosphaeriaceae sp. PMI808]|nr:hypothetical protein GQ44DRAFT_702492 [Phaeosphaeriaceae sp. PMI808]